MVRYVNKWNEKMRKIAIVVAMQLEFDLIKHLIEDGESYDLSNQPCIEGNLYGKRVLLAKSGIGKVNAALQVSEIVAHYGPDYLINSGVAGGLGKALKVADVVVGTECAYHDVWCGEGTWGQIQGMPLTFKANSTLLNALESLENTLLHYGLICTGDQFITEDIRLQEILAHFPDVQAVDMESCAMAHVCYVKQVPFISIRVVSDTPNSEHDNTSEYFDFWKEAPQRTFQVLQQLIEVL